LVCGISRFIRRLPGSRDLLPLPRIGGARRAGGGSGAAGGSGALSGVVCCGAGGGSGSRRSISGGGAVAGSSSTATPCPLCSGSGRRSPSPVGGMPKRTRNLSATSSSTELECVNFSDTPISGRRSKITWDFTSSSRASTLIRIFFINELNVSVEIPNLRELRPSRQDRAPRK